jgi:hypothetical protein
MYQLEQKVVPVLAHSDTGFYMTSPNDDIVLRKHGEPEEEQKKLPFGVYAMTLDNRLIFVRRLVGRFVPVSPQEQEQLCQQFRL